MDESNPICPASRKALKVVFVCAYSYKCKKNIAVSFGFTKNFGFLTCQGIAKKLYQCKNYISSSWISTAEPPLPLLLSSRDMVKFQCDKESSERNGSKKTRIKMVRMLLSNATISCGRRDARSATLPIPCGC